MNDYFRSELTLAHQQVQIGHNDHREEIIALQNQSQMIEEENIKLTEKVQFLEEEFRKVKQIISEYSFRTFVAYLLVIPTLVQYPTSVVSKGLSNKKCHSQEWPGFTKAINGQKSFDSSQKRV